MAYEARRSLILTAVLTGISLIFCSSALRAQETSGGQLPATLKINDAVLEIFSDGYHEHCSAGLMYGEEGYAPTTSQHDPKNLSPFQLPPLSANLVLFSDHDRVLLKLPVEIRVWFVGASYSAAIIFDDDEWGIANVEALSGKPPRTILGIYKGLRGGLCPLLGGSCFLAYGPAGLRLYNGAFELGLRVDLSYVHINLSAKDPSDPRWDRIVEFTD